MASDYDVSYLQDIIDIREIPFRMHYRVANSKNRYTKLRKSDTGFLAFHVIVQMLNRVL